VATIFVLLNDIFIGKTLQFFGASLSIFGQLRKMKYRNAKN